MPSGWRKPVGVLKRQAICDGECEDDPPAGVRPVGVLKPVDDDVDGGVLPAGSLAGGLKRLATRSDLGLYLPGGVRPPAC
jgi:hypothetical protein